MAMNSELKPTHMRNSMAKTPSMFSGLKVGLNAKPMGMAMSSIMRAWNMERSVAEKTLLRIITERETIKGYLKHLWQKYPSYRAQKE